MTHAAWSRVNNSIVEIRLAGCNDIAAIVQVLHESFKEYRTLYTDGGFAATALSAEQVGRRIDEGPVWVALLDGAVLGTAAAVSKGPDLYIRGMAVLPRARGHRIGESLLKEIETYATQQRSRRLFLSTTPFLDRAIRLYQTFGFRRTEEGPHELFGTPLFTMEKFLRADDSPDASDGGRSSR